MYEYLRLSDEITLELSFEDIEAILERPLPKSARTNSAFWSNRTSGALQAKAWMDAGYHAADGYPGTPSTEVIDKSLKYVQDRIKVGWSVNEAVAVGVAVGHSVAGFDTVVTMKIPGIFQAGDAITTSAFYTAKAGALVIFAASDYVPSSTQHVIDVRHFFASSRLPVLYLSYQPIVQNRLFCNFPMLFRYLQILVYRR